MSDSFDPYHVWLGIPPDERPPTHYRLLGLREFESDGDAITNAYDQRRVFLRTLQNGKRADLSQKILNEVTRAGVILLDPEQKSAYDASLRAAKAKAAPAAPIARPLPVAPQRAIPLPPPRPAMPAPPPQPYPQAGFAPLPHLPMPPHRTSAPPSPYGYAELPSFAPLPQLPPTPSYPSPPQFSTPLAEELEPPAAVILPSPEPLEPILPRPQSAPLRDWYSRTLAPQVEMLAAQLRIPPWAVLSGVASVAAVLFLLLASSLWNSRRPTPPIAQPAPQPPPVVTPPAQPVAPPNANPGPENPTPPPSVSPPVETNPTPPVETNPTPPVVPPPIANPAPPPPSEPQTPKVWLADAGSPRVLLRQVDDLWLLRVGPHYTWCPQIVSQPNLINVRVGNSRTVLLFDKERVLQTSLPLNVANPKRPPFHMTELARGRWISNQEIPKDMLALPAKEVSAWSAPSEWALAFDRSSKVSSPLPAELANGDVDFTIELVVRLSPSVGDYKLLTIGPLMLVGSPRTSSEVFVGLSTDGANARGSLYPTETSLNLVVEYHAARKAFRLRRGDDPGTDFPWPQDRQLQDFVVGGVWQGHLLGCRISRGLRYAGSQAIGPTMLQADEQTLSLWSLRPQDDNSLLQDALDPARRIVRTRTIWARLTPLRTPAEELLDASELLQAIDVRQHIVQGICDQTTSRALSTDPSGEVLVLAPGAAPGNYTLKIIAARTAGNGGLRVILPIADRQLSLVIDQHLRDNEYYTGVFPVPANSGQVGKPALLSEAAQTITLSVYFTTDGGKQIRIEGPAHELLWEGALPALPPSTPRLPFRPAFAFGSNAAGVTIHSLLLIEPSNHPRGLEQSQHYARFAEQLGLTVIPRGREPPGMIPGGAASPPPATSGPPTASQMQAAEARVRARFAAELAADSNPSVLGNLGRQLWSEGMANRDLAECRALLQLSAEFHLRAGAPKSAYQSALTLDQRMDDSSWTEIRRIFLQSRPMFGPGGPIGNTPRDNIQRDAAAQIALKLAELGVLMRNRNQVTDGLADAESIGIQDPLDAARRLRLKYLLAGWDEALQAEATLKTNPNDPVAQTTLGRWTCLGLEDFSTGAPWFAKGGTTGAHRIAAREAAAMGDAKKRFDVAEEWRTVAVTDAQEKAAIRRHCLSLYQAALPELKASDKLRAEGRIRELEAEKVAPLPLGFQNNLKAPAGPR